MPEGAGRGLEGFPGVEEAVLVAQSPHPVRLPAGPRGEQRRYRTEVAVAELLLLRHRPDRHHRQVTHAHLQQREGEVVGTAATGPAHRHVHVAGVLVDRRGTPDARPGTETGLYRAPGG